MRGSIVLAADDPANLARFYGALLNAPAQQGWGATHWRVPWPAGGFLELYAPSRSRPQPRQPGRMALCLQQSVDAGDPAALLQAWIQQATAEGGSLLEPARHESFGVEAWLLDPEGNRLLLLVQA
jgi:predicted enzyme related to lactoylglutathione lyase